MSLYRKLEATANVAIIVVALLFGWVVVTKFVSHSRNPAPPSSRRIESLAAGEKLALADVDWKTNGRTLIIALKKDCRFCNESADFHRKLLLRAREKRLPVIAILPSQPLDSKDYVRSLGLEMSDIRQAELKSLKIAGVPTLVLVDANGSVERVWTGKLEAADEAEAIRLIG